MGGIVSLQLLPENHDYIVFDYHESIVYDSQPDLSAHAQPANIHEFHPEGPHFHSSYRTRSREETPRYSAPRDNNQTRPEPRRRRSLFNRQPSRVHSQLVDSHQQSSPPTQPIDAFPQQNETAQAVGGSRHWWSSLHSKVKEKAGAGRLLSRRRTVNGSVSPSPLPGDSFLAQTITIRDANTDNHRRASLSSSTSLPHHLQTHSDEALSPPSSPQPRSSTQILPLISPSRYTYLGLSPADFEALLPPHIIQLSFLEEERKEAKQCTICYESLSGINNESPTKPGADVLCLPTCGHLFHIDCFRPWVQLRNSCPICRVVVFPSLS